jgi:endonuclease/exonuclease/phosphatase family metal-dependent hydrolase
VKWLIKIINIAVIPITWVSAILLFISGQSPAISPEYTSLLALVGMAFPLLVVLNLILAVYWAIQLKLSLLVPVLSLVFHFSQLLLYVQWNSSNNQPKQALKVISYNANLFGVMREQWDLDSVSTRIQSEQPDILLLQEVYNPKGSLKELAKTISKSTALPYWCHYPLSKKKPNYGMVVLSKYPIKNWDKIYFPHETGNMAMLADIGVKNDQNMERTIRFYNIHLQSIRFNKKDYRTIEEVNQEKHFDKENTEGIINRIRKAYEKRAPQVNVLKEEIANCRSPKFVMGDFNDVPLSYTYYQLTDNLKDAFVSRGSGLETTYKGPFPSFRIDYQLYSNEIECASYKSIKKVPSDHKMIVGTYDIATLFQ